MTIILAVPGKHRGKYDAALDATCPQCGLDFLQGAHSDCESDPQHSNEGETCPACGDFVEYCLGHGVIGDPDGAAIIMFHEDGRHMYCARGSDCR